MKKTGILILVGLCPALAFAQGGLIKIGGETLLQGGKAVAERAITQQTGSALTAGISGGVLKGMEIPFSAVPGQTSLVRSVASAAAAAAPQTVTLAPLAQQLSTAVIAAQKANQALFHIAALRPGFAMDSYPAELQAKYQETARISAQELPLPLTSDELELLVAADTQGEFFEVDPDLEEGYVVAVFRKKMHVNVAPGSFMAHTNIGGILKIEKSQYEALQRAVQTMSDKEISDLKYRAGISYYDGGRKYLEYDEFRGLVSSGDSEFFGGPFLAVLQRKRWDDSVGVFFRVKKNLIVRSNFVFYSLPAGSYVAMNPFTGSIGDSQFVFDAKPLIRPFNPDMTRTLQDQLQKRLSDNTGPWLPISIMIEQEGNKSAIRSFYLKTE